MSELCPVLAAKNDLQNIEDDFPIFNQTDEKPFIYLDSAASAQKPYRVIEAMTDFYTKRYANIYRGVYALSQQATEYYESTRDTVKEWIGAASAKEIVFVRGATEAINLVAESYGRPRWEAGDEVILSIMEHHSNILPWYLLKKRVGIVLKVIPMTQEGLLDLEAYQALFSERTKFVSLIHVSNVLGVVNPIHEMTAIAHAHRVPILVDGAQAVPHVSVNVQALDCDFYVFSAHKLYGPTGIGVLYAKEALLSTLAPYQGGGGMIHTVHFDSVTFVSAPQKFEAGTPDIAGVIGLKAAIQYLESIGGISAIFAHEQALLAYAESMLRHIPGLNYIGPARPKVGVLSFTLEGIHAHDVGTVLDHEGIAIRAGHHCAMPLIQALKVPATVRVSLGVYNNEEDILALVRALKLAKRLFH